MPANVMAAVAAAVSIGTRLGPGIVVVAAGFGFWCAVAGLLYLRATVPPRR